VFQHLAAMTTFSAQQLGSPKTSRLKGPETSVGSDGDWSPGLLRSHAYEKLLTDIILGDLAPMSVLDERVLAARYATGVAGVRDALGRLALEGLVVRRPRVGTVVAPLDLREIENAFQVRHMLEARTAALAAEKASEADLIAITSAFDGAEAAIAAGDIRAMLLMDRQFHKSVAAATHNPTLARFVVSLQNVATRFWIWAMERQSPDDQLADVERHRELARCIAARDAIAAETAAAHLVGDPPSAYR
jgi:DNA-binding GntR family transcriptional regulator